MTPLVRKQTVAADEETGLDRQGQIRQRSFGNFGPVTRGMLRVQATTWVLDRTPYCIQLSPFNRSCAHTPRKPSVLLTCKFQGLMSLSNEGEECYGHRFIVVSTYCFICMRKYNEWSCYAQPPSSVSDLHLPVVYDLGNAFFSFRLVSHP